MFESKNVPNAAATKNSIFHSYLTMFDFRKKKSTTLRSNPAMKEKKLYKSTRLLALHMIKKEQKSRTADEFAFVQTLARLLFLQELTFCGVSTSCGRNSEIFAPDNF